MFITTANSLNMSQPLLDRMEIIRIPGYTEDEKVEIAKQHLIPEQTKEHGLKPSEFSLSEDALRDIIRYYTREAGVRGLKREIASLARKVLTKIVSKEVESIDVTSAHLEDLMGVKKHRFGITDTENQVGVVTGLAWTSVGGDILTIEAVSMAGKGAMKITGNLKDVMKESISAAKSYVQSKAPELGISPRTFGSLPIGGLKEKLLAALRGGVKTVLIPQENAKDLADIPENVKGALEIIPVEHVSEVLTHALTKKIKPVEWTSSDKADLAGLMMGTPGATLPEGGSAAH